MASNVKQKKTNTVNGPRCVVYGCSNTYKNSVSLHSFPKETKRRDLWVKFIKKRRKYWSTPTNSSVICSDHFENNCFPSHYKLQEELGIPRKKRKLNDDAVPTMYPQLEKLRNKSRPLNKAQRIKNVERILQDITQSQTTINVEDGGNVLNKTNAENAQYQNIDHGNVGLHCTVACSNECDISEHSTVQASETVVYVEIVNDVQTPTKSVRARGIQVKPGRKSVSLQVANLNNTHKGTQTDCPVREGSTQVEGVLQVNSYSQCDILKTPTPEIEEELTSSDEEQSCSEPSDSDYVPSDDEEENDDTDTSKSSDDGYQRRLFLVEENCLRELCAICPSCHSTCLVVFTDKQGTLINAQRDCGVCGHSSVWRSQHFVNETPYGNLQLSMAILFTGSSPAQALRIFHFMNTPCIAADTYFRHQHILLQPAILDRWEAEQKKVIEAASKRSLILAGDGRCDTPGHSAKFGSYTVMDLKQNKVLDIQLIQSNEGRGSNAMEKEGLARSLAKLKALDVRISKFITDRHVQVVKFLRETHPEIEHRFDTWHVGKGLKKKLTALGNEKDCDAVHGWQRSIINHLYWTAASSQGDSELMVEKWKSLAGHIANTHEHPELRRFPGCQHGVLPMQLNKRWMRPGTKAYEKLYKVIMTTRLLKDVRMLASTEQTSTLEGFHSVINHFAPKMFGFSYMGMKARIALAALHYNANSVRKVRKTKKGKEQCAIFFPKYKPGEPVLRVLREKPTYGYISSLQERVLQLAVSAKQCDLQDQLKEQSENMEPIPPPLSSCYVHPDKEEFKQQWRSRYVIEEATSN